MTGTIYVVDLDGTLLKSNSFYFFLFIVLKRLMSKKIISFFYVLYRILLRKLKLIKHIDLLNTLQFFWIDQNLSNQLFFKKKLDQYLKKNIRLDLISFIEKIKKNDDIIILSTAAAYEFSSLIFKKYKIFDKLHSTSSYGHKNQVHNKGINKVKKILNLNKNLRYNIISFTDHIDDLPLIKISTTAYLFTPVVHKINDYNLQYTKLINYNER